MKESLHKQYLLFQWNILRICFESPALSGSTQTDGQGNSERIKTILIFSTIFEIDRIRSILLAFEWFHFRKIWLVLPDEFWIEYSLVPPNNWEKYRSGHNF